MNKIARKILGWFGYRPKQKDLRVFIRVRDNDTGEWAEIKCDESVKLDINPPDDTRKNDTRR